MNDLISRQAAIDELNVSAELLRRVLDDADIVGAVRAKYEWGLELIELHISVMKELPPAQPESLTDKEQRIFLAAMTREEKVCKQVDEEWRDCRETHDDSLVRTCHEIERKVKGALWT